MIEQEKAAEFRFDTSEKGLSERLTEVGLPSYARLYSCTGLPNVFGWRNIEKAESFQETWLYIPDNVLETISNSQKKFNDSSADYEPLSNHFKVDNFNLYPVQSAGKLVCLIAAPESEQFGASSVDFTKIARLEKESSKADKSDSVQIAYEFVSRLFDCKQSFSDFAQRLLILLTDQVDKSYAGLYWKSSDCFHRRWAYGDLQLSDKLLLSVTFEMVEKWQEANSGGRSFVPAERMMDEPIFVQTPPSYLFVHKTANFGDREQWLVMAVPGDISAAAISRITIIASLLSSMDDERISGYAELVTMFGELVNGDRKAQSLDEAIGQSFKLLDEKLRMNSMCLLNRDNSLLSCIREFEDRLRVEKSKVSKIPDEAMKVMDSLEPAFLDGPSHGPLDRTAPINEAETAHVFFPVPIAGDEIALLSAEFSGDISRARKQSRLFELVAKYLGVCISLQKIGTNDPQVVGTPVDEISEVMSLARLKTISKINGGYFHELIEFLSVILGQAELIDYELQKSARPITTESLLMSTDRIVRAAGSLANVLEELKNVSTVKVIEDGSLIDSEQFLSQLKHLSYGYFLTVKDNKNVDIEIQPKVDKSVSFTFPVLHIFDYIMPLIFTVMDEALCSGTIVVSNAEHFGRPVFRISYPKKLLGKMTFDKLADKVFKYHQLEKTDQDGLVVSVDKAHFLFSESGGDRAQVIYSLSNQLHPVEDF